jgi:hypothetical protein
MICKSDFYFIIIVQLKYSDHSPHEGYDILDKWCSRISSSRSRPAEVNPFYVYTSNVDGQYVHLVFDYDSQCLQSFFLINIF